MFLAFIGPLGRILEDRRLYLPESCTSYQERCATAGCQGREEATARRRSWHWRCWSRHWSWAV